jgi:hypothetical protein
VNDKEHAILEKKSYFGETPAQWLMLLYENYEQVLHDIALLKYYFSYRVASAFSKKKIAFRYFKKAKINYL